MLTHLILALLMGALAGWLAGKFMKGRGFGAVGNIIVGVVGGVVGRLLFGILGMAPSNFIGSLFTSVVGAIVLLFAIAVIKKSP